MQIFVRNDGGKTITIEIEPTATCYELACNVYDKDKGSPRPCQQRLIFHARPGHVARVEAAAKDRRLRDKECPVCMEKPKNTTLVPCGHRVCDSCATQVRDCPFCKQAFTQTVRNYN